MGLSACTVPYHTEIVRAAILALWLAYTCLAQNAGSGLEVGKRIPAFTLNDQTGAPQSFDSIKKSKGALLVFFRSADW